MKLRTLFFTLVVLSISTYAFATPYVVSGQFNASEVTTCIMTDTNSEEVTADPIVVPDESASVEQARCVFDLANAPEGENNISLHTQNMWGVSEQVPFVFTKVLPPTLSNIQLEQ